MSSIKFENPFQIMHDSILLKKNTKLVSARSAASTYVYLQSTNSNWSSLKSNSIRLVDLEIDIPEKYIYYL